MRDGTLPPPGALVTVLTGNREIDAPETWARLGLGTVSERPHVGIFAFVESEERVRSAGGWSFVHRATAASDGAFEIAVPPDLPDFYFTVDADHAVYPRRRGRFVLEGPEVRDGVVLSLEPAGGIEGRLVAPDSSPVAHAEVRLVNETDRPWELPTAYSSLDGRFVIRGVKAGRYGAYTRAAGFRSAIARDVVVRLGETTRLDFALPAESFIEGIVVDADGKGVEGVNVQAHRGVRGSSSSVEAHFNGLDGGGRVTTDASGAFRIGGLREAAYSVSVHRNGMLSSDQVIEVPVAGGIADLRFALEAGGSIAGRVVDDLGIPVAGASVSAFAGSRTGKGKETSVRTSAHQSCRSSQDGTFRLSGLADAPHQVFANAEGHGDVRLPAVGISAMPLEIVLPRAAAISGVVRAADTGEPITTLRIVPAPYKVGEISGHAYSTPSNVRAVEAPGGRFELKGLNPVAHDFTFLADGFLPQTLVRVELKSADRREGIEVDLRRAGSARGTVVEKGSQTPIAGALVSTVGPLGAGRGAPGRFAMAFLLRDDECRSEFDGSFQIDSLEPGPVRLRADVESFPSGETTVEVRAGMVVEGVVIEVSKGGAIEGVYLDEAGAPAKGATVHLLGVGLSAPVLKESALDPTGSFRFEGVSAGRYVVRGMPAGRSRVYPTVWGATAQVDVADGSVARVELRTAPHGRCTLRGRVLRGDEGDERARVSVVSVEEAAESWRTAFASRRSQTNTDATGGYSIDGLRSGVVVLVVESVHRSEKSFFPLEIPDADQFRFDARIPSGSISIRATSASAAEPVREFVLSLVPYPWDVRSDASWIPGANVVAQDGRFRMDDLAPGTYFVTVTPGGALAPQTRGPIAVPGDSASVVEFALQEGGSAVVTVVDAAGAPVAGANVYLFPADASWNPNRHVLAQRGTTDSSGDYHVACLANGDYVAAVVAPDGTETRGEPATVRKGTEARFRIELRR